jgi:hypothetical protein
MLVLSDERVEEGTSLVVSFQATDLPIWFDTCATVTRVVQARRPFDVGRALGIHFDTLPAVSRLILRGYLRRMPLTQPMREPPLEMAARLSGRGATATDYAGMVRSILEQ